MNCIDTKYLKSEAKRLGFSACGVTSVRTVDTDVRKCFQEWIAMKKHGDMKYLANHFEKRINPSLLMEDVQSIVSVALNYYPDWMPKSDDQYEFAWYAYGRDYHDVMKSYLNKLLDAIRLTYPKYNVNARIFCDTAPVLERYWAWKCGLGWIGKNTQLIIPSAGSAFFLGELFLNQKFTAYDEPQVNRCGECTRCIECCPTHALESPYSLNASRCLSYLTIEYRGELPDDIGQKMGNCIYGCDRCQIVCPWNKFAQPTKIPEFKPSEEFKKMTREQLQRLSVEEYRSLFKDSAVKRVKYDGLKRNIEAVF